MSTKTIDIIIVLVALFGVEAVIGFREATTRARRSNGSSGQTSISPGHKRSQHFIADLFPTVLSAFNGLFGYFVRSSVRPRPLNL
jgi:hypothetical protein